MQVSVCRVVYGARYKDKAGAACESVSRYQSVSGQSALKQSALRDAAFASLNVARPGVRNTEGPNALTVAIVLNLIVLLLSRGIPKRF